MDNETNPCQDLNDFLAGTLRVEYFADVEEILKHWEDCGTCQLSFPDANTKIQRAEYFWMRQIKQVIEHVHLEYNIAKSAILMPVSPEPPSLSVPQAVEFVPFLRHAEDEALKKRPTIYSTLLVMLSEKGEIIREYLQIMNDNWGLDYFRLAFEDSEDSCEYDSRFCGSLISSLSRDTQRFVIQSILVSDVLKYFDIELLPGFDWTLYRTLEYAAPEFLRVYLEKQKSLGFNQDIRGLLSEPDRRDFSTLVEKIDSLKDGVDSVKAGQMELCHLSKRNTYKPTEIEDDLANHLGKEL